MTEQTFLLPDLGEGLTEAEVMEWHVAVGDEVVVDQVVVTVETAPATAAAGEKARVPEVLVPVQERDRAAGMRRV